MAARSVFLTGATGYMGVRLGAALLARGHRLRALARPASVDRLPSGCEPVVGDALDAASFEASVRGCDTLVHLVGVAHPSPAKAADFRRVDLASARAAIAAAAAGGVGHFVYVSVARPAPVMRAYQAARADAEDAIAASGLAATILRPWYVLGPGHRWPCVLLPLYFVAERLPSMRDDARRLGLVTIDQMVRALVSAAETPAVGVRVVDVPGIRAARPR